MERDITIQFVPLEIILPLRKAVIIAGTNRDTPYFTGDDAPDTLHVGVFASDECVGCATLLYSRWESAPAWQLRGMAVAAERQRAGIGTALLQFLEAALPNRKPAIGVWCNAREKAVPFYTSAGFSIVSDRFVIENVGPHFKLFKAFANPGIAAQPQALKHDANAVARNPASDE
ncbi:MAG TPA: N-acetyltransferase [Candidatus Hydrogenedentes bacterium]|nr:N-acetyltransferase [Candidatus Hydrogenedentota bacterium]